PILPGHDIDLTLADDIEGIAAIALAHQGLALLKRLNRELDGEEVELTRGRVTEERHRPQPLAFLQGRAHLAFPGDDATELGPENPLVEDEQAHGGDRLHGRLADAPPAPPWRGARWRRRAAPVESPVPGAAAAGRVPGWSAALFWPRPAPAGWPAGSATAGDLAGCSVGSRPPRRRGPARSSRAVPG